MRIIIADDDESVRKILVGYIKNFLKNAEIDEVDDGLPLVEKIEKNHYDLVITDNSMKKMDGLEATRIIRKFNSKIPIYMMSGDENKKDEALIIWRRQKTKEQWTPEFREKRINSYTKTYYNKTIKLMKQTIEKEGNLYKFDKIRIENNDKSVLSMKTFCSRLLFLIELNFFLTYC